MTTSPEGAADPEVPVEAAAEDGREESAVLEKRAVKGSLLEMGFYGASQVLRLGSNLLLTRLLFPEAFGLMTTLAVFNTGLIMLSDVGIEQSVIQNPDGDKREFLNTAWTLQILRGGLLYAVALVLTWPMAYLEQQSDLLLLIPVGSLSVLIAAFGSTGEFTLRRRVQPGRILALDFVTQAIGVAVMVVWAWVHPSVWALVGGNLVREAIRTVATHFVFGVDYRNRWGIHQASRDAIAKFGRWILGSSSVFYLAGFADRLVLLPFIGAERLGIYSIAALLSEAAFTVIGKVIHGVVFPVFSRVGEEGHERLREVYYRARLRLDALAMTAIGGLVTLGPSIVHLLWDDRYADAGWMLQILAFKAGTRTVFVPADYCLMSVGLVRYGFANNLARAIWLFAGIPIGHALGGEIGIFWAIALSDLPSVLILWPKLAAEKLLRPERELLAWVFAAFGAGLGWVAAQALAWVMGG